MSLDFEISLKNKEVNILPVQDNVYVLVNGTNYFLFDIDKFEIIIDINEYNLKRASILLYNKVKNRIEIIKKDLVTQRNIQVFREEIYENRYKIKYLSNGRIFLGSYPNKFFIFENN